jgi:HAD superfamily hydrolase (TIGR01490 family)
MATAITQILSFVRNKQQDELLERCHQFTQALIRKKAFPKMLYRIEEHHGMGHDTWIISAAPKEITSQIALHLKMTGAFGTVGEVKNGCYTGKLESEPMHGPVKAQTVKKLAASRNYQLRECFAYSDSINDLPLLASVGNPVVVNANKQLVTIAQKNSWKVLHDLK